LVKGPPGERRAHLDGFVSARWPSRSELRRRYGQALAQRNALIARVAMGAAGAGELDAWDASLADVAAELSEARAEAVDELAPAFTTAAEELGLGAAASLEYAPRATGSSEELRAGLADRRDADLRLGRTSWGPHLDEVKLLAGEGRSLRRYGSQGEQRAGLLALIFAEREALMEAHRVTPLLLLDDVMSELDPDRRELLVERLARGGQTLITAASLDSVPARAREQLVRMPAAPGGEVAAAA
jgi:DNA replication and repair protein RecF